MVDNIKKQNLYNAKSFFKNHLKMNVFWSKDVAYDPPFCGEVFLVIQFSSCEQLAKYFDVGDCVCNNIDKRSITDEAFAKTDPGVIFRTEYFMPYVLLQEFFDKKDHSTACVKSFGGLIGKNFNDYINYFLYCLNREEEAFKYLNKKTKNEIEDYLKKADLQILRG